MRHSEHEKFIEAEDESKVNEEEGVGREAEETEGRREEGEFQGGESTRRTHENSDPTHGYVTLLGRLDG